MSARIVLEVCTDSAAGARAAEEGGAQRVELCAALGEGGITPSAGAIAAARGATTLDLVVMIRPRGGDFLYGEDELAVMERDIDTARDLGANGVAFGVLDAGGSVDTERTARLIARARPLDVVFHRAFDVTRDAREALAKLVELGVDRVLTSGRAATVPEGLPLIRELVEEAAGDIVVVPAGGVREHNIREVIAETGAGEIHFTAGETSASPMQFRNDAVRMASSRLPGEHERVITTRDRVRRFADALADIG